MKVKYVVITVIVTLIVVMTVGGVGLFLFNYSSLAKESIEVGTEDYPINVVKSEYESMELRQFSNVYYGYKQLAIEEQKLYCAVYDALYNYVEYIEIPTDDKKTIDLVFNCVMCDHPEIFYVTGYQYTVAKQGDTLTSVKLMPTYCMSKQEIESYVKQIKETVTVWFSDAPDNGDEYSTIKYFYEYIIKHVDYDIDSRNNQNICSAFLQGRSVCQGYAKAYQYCLQKCNIQAFLVTGNANGDKHAWVLVRLDNKYYYVDPTWGDASYLYAKEMLRGIYALPLNYDYFLVTTDELTRTHTIDSKVTLPNCFNVEDNYFIKEGLYFESYDEAALKYVFANYETVQDGYINIKCDSLSTYNIFMQKLIQEQGIFNVAANVSDKLSYTSDQYQKTLSFWNFR